MESTKTTNDFKGMLGQLESVFDDYLGKKAPQLPENVREIIVKIAPYAEIRMVIMGIMGVLAIFGLTGVAMPYMMAYGASPLYFISTVIMVIGLVMSGMAIPGLFARSKQGWNLIYWASLVNVVSMLVRFDLISVLFSVIGLYILFQIKSKYK